MSPRLIADLLEECCGIALEQATAELLSAYLALLSKWNARTNLTAIRSDREIVLRHFGESLACAAALPTDAETLLDFGSGAGFPGAVCAIMCPRLRVCLAEAQGKKAAFLMELSRTLGVAFEVHAGRVESLAPSRRFDVVTLRAVDCMAEACGAALGRVQVGGRLMLLATQAAEASLQASLAGAAWHLPLPLPGSEQRLLLVGTRTE